VWSEKFEGCRESEERDVCCSEDRDRMSYSVNKMIESKYVPFDA
jgi:hypothetical protein